METIRIKATDPASECGFVVINKSDFDPQTMVEYVDGDRTVAPRPKGQRAK